MNRNVHVPFLGEERAVTFFSLPDPRTKPKARQKSYMGFQTGDIVKAVIPTGKYVGTHEGRIAIRFRPSFHLNAFDVAPKYLTLVHRHDGYSYEKGVLHSSPSLKA